QAGINAAINGDTILVADGTYIENINYIGKAITVSSQYVMDGDTNHINNTIIDGSQPTNPDSGSVVYFASNEDTNSVLTGFTITGGSGTIVIFLPGWDPKKAGGGILVNSSGAKIENNKITNNNVTAIGDTVVDAPAIMVFGDSADYVIIRDNQISENRATQVDRIALGGAIVWGGVGTCLFEKNRVTNNVCNGVLAFGGGLSILGRLGVQWSYIVRNNIIKDNIVNASDYGGGGGIYIENCSPEVTNNIISSNGSSHEGGGIWVFHRSDLISVAQPVFINNTITNNSATYPGGGILVSGSPQANVKMMNNILWGNIAPTGKQIDTWGGAIIQVRYSDVQGGWTGEGNINANPQFADTLLYNLSVSSPCVGWGTDSTLGYLAPPFDYDGDPRPNPVDYLVDMGAQESYFPNGITKDDTDNLAKVYSLKQNYPNPFNPSTTIEFSIPKSEFVTLKIYNLLGQEVVMLVSDKLTPGSYKYTWDASGFASGIYYYKIESVTFMQTKKLILLK
ncbi:MAG: T9SS type A sorting domain-containing protein, partial [Gammaproteobacteria bacterium]|nr:T9SS type A sorting domain-containing protein [Gammaproteobacteria bacterium]